MHALVYTDTQTLVYREEKNPTEKPGESILKIQASGICGSDMHAYHGHDERRVPPLILGHEVSGIIQNGKFKDKVVVLNPLITCGNCEYCKQGREHLCPDRSILGMSKPIKREGGLAEYVSIPDKNIYEIPNGFRHQRGSSSGTNGSFITRRTIRRANFKETYIRMQGINSRWRSHRFVMWFNFSKRKKIAKI